MKEEIAKKVVAWNGVSVVSSAKNADLVLEVVQSGKLNVMTGSGNKGAAVLKDARTGEDLWNDSRGGGWSMRAASVIGQWVVSWEKSWWSFCKVM